MLTLHRSIARKIIRDNFTVSSGTDQVFAEGSASVKDIRNSTSKLEIFLLFTPVAHQLSGLIGKANENGRIDRIFRPKVSIEELRVCRSMSSPETSASRTNTQRPRFSPICLNFSPA